jgi:long-subunit fatty acid transport protein
VPVVAITSDLGGVVKGLHVAAGLYAPNAYPFRDMTNVNGKTFVFNQSADSDPPPPTRYDIMKQTAAVEIPSVAAAYRILDNLDVGARFGLAFAQLESTVALWGEPDNYSEWIKDDGQVHLKATAAGVPNFSLGTTFRPTREIELAANYTSAIAINATGTAQALNGPNVSLAGAPIVIAPTTGTESTCKPNSVGTADALNACVSIELPQSAQIGARYKFLDATGKLRGDIELDLDWENWGGAGGTSDGSKLGGNAYGVTIDAQVETVGNTQTGIPLKPSVIYHDFQDTYGVRLGGSYVLPMGTNDLIFRGGVGYDTAAAQQGWLRADIDGAARTTLAAGVGYKLHRVQIDAGFGLVLEGTQTNANAGPSGALCNPTPAAMGCVGTNMDQAQASRHGPDPTNPLLDSSLQTENPVNQGTFLAHYVMFMLGAKTWF